jgi:hypothetical protein
MQSDGTPVYSVLHTQAQIQLRSRSPRAVRTVYILDFETLLNSEKHRSHEQHQDRSDVLENELCHYQFQ